MASERRRGDRDLVLPDLASRTRALDLLRGGRPCGGRDDDDRRSDPLRGWRRYLPRSCLAEMASVPNDLGVS
jgi:hypothetical protein